MVLGLLRKDALTGDPATPVEQVMESGPVTFRPGKPLDAILQHLRRTKRDEVLITTSDGQLVGLLNRQDAERAS